MVKNEKTVTFKKGKQQFLRIALFHLSEMLIIIFTNAPLSIFLDCWKADIFCPRTCPWFQKQLSQVELLSQSTVLPFVQEYRKISIVQKKRSKFLLRMCQSILVFWNPGTMNVNSIQSTRQPSNLAICLKVIRNDNRNPNKTPNKSSL